MATPSDRNVTRGILWMLATGLLFVGVTGVVRHIGTALPAAESAFLRYVIGTAMLLPFIWRDLLRPRPARSWGVFAFRGAAHSLGVVLWFFAMARIPIAEVTAIGYTAPIYITIGAALFFGEKLAARRIMAVVLAFAGALIILRPGFREVGPGQIAQLLSAPLFAVSYLMTKRLTATESPGVIVGLLSVFVTLALAPMAISVWVWPDWREVGWLALVAALATTGHWTMTKGLQAAPLTVTQPVTFLQLVWATALGALVFGEAIDGWILLGGAVIIGAVTFIAYREAMLGRSRAARTQPPDTV